MQKTHYYRNSIPGFSLDEVFVGSYYDAEMQRKIHRFKFVHNRVDRVYFESLFAHMQKEFPAVWTVIVYPPVSMKDRILRGPNHARYLAEYFGGKLPIICPFHKKFFAAHQSRRNKKEREIIQSEILWNEKFTEAVRGKDSILVDDLITTGYTAHTLGKLLKQAGAKSVVGYFLASEKI